MSDSEKSPKNEKFILDAKLEEMISISAFRASLQNGHRLVAYIPRYNMRKGHVQLCVGDTVKVSLSPFDMSRGEVVQE